MRYLMLAVLLCLNSPSARSQQAADAEQAAKVKAVVARIGTGDKAHVRVKRLSKPKVKGIINEIEEDSFTVISTENGSIGTQVVIPYSEVVEIKGKGIDWRQGAIKTGGGALKALGIMGKILKGACVGCQLPP